MISGHSSNNFSHAARLKRASVINLTRTRTHAHAHAHAPFIDTASRSPARCRRRTSLCVRGEKTIRQSTTHASNTRRASLSLSLSHPRTCNALNFCTRSMFASRRCSRSSAVCRRRPCIARRRVTPNRSMASTSLRDDRGRCGRARPRRGRRRCAWDHRRWRRCAAARRSRAVRARGR